MKITAAILLAAVAAVAAPGQARAVEGCTVEEAGRLVGLGYSDEEVRAWCARRAASDGATETPAAPADAAPAAPPAAAGAAPQDTPSRTRGLLAGENGGAQKTPTLTGRWSVSRRLTDCKSNEPPGVFGGECQSLRINAVIPLYWDIEARDEGWILREVPDVTGMTAACFAGDRLPVVEASFTGNTAEFMTEEQVGFSLWRDAYRLEADPARGRMTGVRVTEAELENIANPNRPYRLRATYDLVLVRSDEC